MALRNPVPTVLPAAMSGPHPRWPTLQAMQQGDTIGTVKLKTAAGAEVELGDYLTKTLVISSPRYYG